MTPLHVLFAPLLLIGGYMVIRVVIEGAVGLVLAVTTVVIGMALIAPAVRRGRDGG